MLRTFRPWPAVTSLDFARFPQVGTVMAISRGDPMTDDSVFGFNPPTEFFEHGVDEGKCKQVFSVDSGGLGRLPGGELVAVGSARQPGSPPDEGVLDLAIGITESEDHPQLELLTDAGGRREFATDVAVDADGSIYSVGWTKDDTTGHLSLLVTRHHVVAGTPPAPEPDDPQCDEIAPRTTVHGPKGRTSRLHPVFRFRASEPDTDFRCRLDRYAWYPCRSPERVGNRHGLLAGRHRFRVRAVDFAGNVGRPAARRFRVVR